MKRITPYLMAVVLSVGTVATAVAQQQAPQPGAMQPSMTTPGAPTPAEHAQHMEMCRQMMGQPGMMGGGMGQGMMRGGMMGPGMMGGGMMGMAPPAGGDPKQQAEMMAMRGEMMKAMGDIMIKYAQRAQSVK
jgi:hypothetical protein